MKLQAASLSGLTSGLMGLLLAGSLFTGIAAAQKKTEPGNRVL